MNGLRYLALLVIITVFSTCDKEDDIEIGGNDYLIFGHFYGFCQGEECIETFKLTDKMLFEDRNDNYAGNGPFDFVKLGDDEFNAVKNLVDFFHVNCCGNRIPF